MGTAVIMGTTIEGVETGTGIPGEVGAGSEYAPHPSGVSLAVGMVGIERSRSTEPSTLARSIRARSVVATRVGLFDPTARVLTHL
jgi:hypothetical protein